MQNNTKALTVSETADMLKNSDDILLVTHSRPDGDTLGSAIALETALRMLGKNSYTVCDDDIPERLSFILNYRTENSENEKSNSLRPECLPENFSPKFIATVDVASLELIGDFGKRIEDQINLKIDHHASGSPFADNELIFDKASACGEIVFDLIKELGISGNNIACALYTAISSDSGSFKFSSVTPQTHLRAAELLSCGIDHSKITDMLYNYKTKRELAASGLAIRNMRYYCNDTLALTTVSLSEMEELGLDRNDIDGINNMPLSVRGVKIGIVIKQDIEPKSYKISVRTNDEYAANEICAFFGGGGHLRAAGARVHANCVEKAVQRTLRAVSRKTDMIIEA